MKTKKNAWDKAMDKEIDKMVSKKKAGQRWMREFKKADSAKQLAMLMPK